MGVCVSMCSIALLKAKTFKAFAIYFFSLFFFIIVRKDDDEL